MQNESQNQAGLETIIAAIDCAVEATPLSIRKLSEPDRPLARRSRSASSAIQGKYIIFTLAAAQYAVPINQVWEVGEPQSVTPVPHVPPWVLGVTNLRGDIISVVDCGAFLRLHEKISLETSSMCVVRNKRRDLTTSLIVDQIEGMINLSEDLIVLPEALPDDPLVPYLQGIYENEGRSLSVLDLEGLLVAMELA